MQFPDSMSLGYLEDHDQVVPEAWYGEGEYVIGFGLGECLGMLLPASERQQSNPNLKKDESVPKEKYL
jgi:hypothetical protein